jgi:NADH-quinone oxidoreductase subunit L
MPWHIILALYLLLPLGAAVLNGLYFRKLPDLASLISTVAAGGMLVCSLLLLGAPDSAPILYRWLDFMQGGGKDASIDISMVLDGLSRGMLLVVAAVGTLVHVFSLDYMKEDAGRGRYFAGLSLFMFSMAGIVLAGNFAMMFMFWELVGVSSYLLIGHWFRKDSAANASKKAFITNRIGDFGFLLGIVLLFGLTGSFDFDKIEAAVRDPNQPLAQGWLVTAALLIFCGAIGKSAQLPLHVWLPDAMEGPTPVSALIHAATMVAAGVYMLARTFFLLEAAPLAADIVTYLGLATSLLAALMALQQDDIKKILAYSTLSQLGYMVMAVGLAAPDAGMFHLFTHAFFKALLFLGAGAVIHALHHEQNIWKMGGLVKTMPRTTLFFGIGMIALMALPPTSGFFSKDSILEAAAHGNDTGVYWLALGVAFLTPFYMMRLFVVAFLGQARGDNAGHAHEVGPKMLLPLAILAVLSLLSGIPGIPQLLGIQAPAFHFSSTLVISLLLSLAGAALGYFRYRGASEDPISIPVFRNKFYFDEFYGKLVAVFQNGLAAVIRGLDVILMDGLLIRFPAWVSSAFGQIARRFQMGHIQTYLLTFSFGVILLVYLAFSLIR